MNILTVRYALVILGLATAYYCLGSISIGRMPFASSLSWWMEIWPSRKVAVCAWFGLMNALGSLIAAVAVAILLRWLIDGNRIRAALTVGAPAAFLTVASVVVHYSPMNRASKLMTAELFLVMFLAVPLLVWIIAALTSNPRFERLGEGSEKES
jgi:fluoride ion exporter CrcB/FEX